jgi:hypothetical protein
LKGSQEYKVLSGCSAAWLAHQHGVLGVGGSNPLTQICFVYNSVDGLIFSFQKAVHNWWIDHNPPFLTTLLTIGEQKRYSGKKWVVIDISTGI